MLRVNLVQNSAKKIVNGFAKIVILAAKSRYKCVEIAHIFWLYIFSSSFLDVNVDFVPKVNYTPTMIRFSKSKKFDFVIFGIDVLQY